MKQSATEQKAVGYRRPRQIGADGEFAKQSEQDTNEDAHLPEPEGDFPQREEGKGRTMKRADAQEPRPKQKRKAATKDQQVGRGKA